MFSGPTGTGKSTRAMAYARDFHGGDVYRARADLLWFNGYEGQEVIIVDDIEYWNCTFVKNFIDQWGLLLPTKGGHVQMMAKVVIFTSNHSFDYLTACLSDANKAAMRRRITEIVINSHSDVISL